MKIKKIVLFVVALYCFSLGHAQSVTKPIIHAHRGGAAEYPENTIEAMLHAVAQGVEVLELDLHVSADGQVVVSHDAYMNPSKVKGPDRKPLRKGTGLRHLLYNMTYNKIQTYDVGSLPVSNFPNRVNLPCKMPLLANLIDEVEYFTRKNKLPSVCYNIEIKSHPLKDHRLTPGYSVFTDMVMAILQPRQLGNRLIIQSFDSRVLNYLHLRYPSLKLSYLFGKSQKTLRELLDSLQFTPYMISPNYKAVSQKLINDAHSKGIKVVPWTVDHRPAVLKLRNMGVDGLITNNPTLVKMWLE